MQEFLKTEPQSMDLYRSSFTWKLIGRFLLKMAKVRGCARISQDRVPNFGPFQVFFYLEVNW